MLVTSFVIFLQSDEVAQANIRVGLLEKRLDNSSKEVKSEFSNFLKKFLESGYIYNYFRLILGWNK